MQIATRGTWLGLAGLVTMTGCASMQPTPKDMTFFVTSAGSGKGANLGGVDGADQHCQALAKAPATGRGAPISARRRLRSTIRSS